MRHWTLRLAIVVAASLCFVQSARGQASQQDLVQILQLKIQLQQDLAAGRMDAAEKSAREMVQKVELAFPGQPAMVAAAKTNLATIYDNEGKHEEGEQLHRSVVETFRTTVGENSVPYVVALNNLATSLSEQGRFSECEPLFLRSIELGRQLKMAEFPWVAKCQSNLAGGYLLQGRYHEAETESRSALAADLKAVGPDNAESIISAKVLADVLARQQRMREAETLYRRTFASVEKVYGYDHPQTGGFATNFALFYLSLNRDEDAAPLFDRAIEIERKSSQPTENLVDLLFMSGMIDLGRGRADAADRKFNEANQLAARLPNRVAASLALGRLSASCVRLLDVQKKSSATEMLAAAQKVVAEIDSELARDEQQFGKSSPQILSDLDLAASVRISLRAIEGARPFVDRGLSIIEANPRDVFAQLTTSSFQEMKAKLLWNDGVHDEAFRLLSAAIADAQARLNASAGLEQDRAQLVPVVLERQAVLSQWYIEIGRVAEAFQASESVRAAGMQRRLEAQGADFLAGISSQEADRLRARRLEIHSRMARLTWKLGRVAADTSLSDAEKQQQTKSLTRVVEQARRDFVDLHREIYNDSPAVRLLANKDFQPVDLPAVQAYCRRTKTLLLEYYLTNDYSALFAIPPNGAAAVTQLEVAEPDAKALGMFRGQIWSNVVARSLATNGSLEPALVCADHTGVLQRLQHERFDAPTANQLAALWHVLIPEDLRKRIVAGEFERIAIIPGPTLANLPFETLVVEPGEKPKFLLDVGPPIVYSPSATVLLNLAARPAGSAKSVLTVGAIEYGKDDAAGGVPDQASARGAYSSLTGPLKPLPYAAWETAWVEESFHKRGVAVESLLGASATESNVRSRLPGHKIVHFACHGLADMSYGNFFGGLALVPGANGDTDPADDGLLTLPEIYELNLAGCELAILSACQTNFGPKLAGEGVAALSRGFLVAGARRVVASDWLVDDESAASQISYCCSIIARQEQEKGTVDYAAALQETKRWARNQEKWSSPYYWATFVQIGAP